MAPSHYVGVDVGTGSARAGVFDGEGKLLGVGASPLQIWKEGDFVEQSSTDIWLAVCAAVKLATHNANVSPEDICGMGFAATCSLVAIGEDESPVTVSLSGDARRNVIVWMDHRAVEQAERINTLHSPVLQFVGGAVSPEMQPPKLLWVKENLQESWAVAFRWMDLSDWLTYRATGDDTRSLCTVVCKWTYMGHAHMQQMTSQNSLATEACGWDDVFWQEIGLGNLVEGNYAKIGASVAFPGHPLGSGLKATAAKELGLLKGTPVGVALIDAHAGGVGVMEGVPKIKEISDSDEALCSRLVLVCGTSTCHMVVSKNKIFIPGVWGPYWSAMIPEFWLTEGGQSATGALLDHIVENHSAAPILANRAASQKISIYEVLNNILESIAEGSVPFKSALTKDIHVLPDFHGNRSPLADPKSKGMISGLTLSSSEKDLALLYYAVVQSIAYGTRHIIEHCNAHGHKESVLPEHLMLSRLRSPLIPLCVFDDEALSDLLFRSYAIPFQPLKVIETLIACGGLSKNSVFIQEHADITGCSVILPREKETVLLGAAVLGAVASKQFESVHHAMKMLNAPGEVVEPSKDERVKKYHDAKYKIFRTLYEQQVSFREAMATVCE